MVKVSNLGYPRLGENREWKKLIESYWSGNISQAELEAQAKVLRLSFLKKQETTLCNNSLSRIGDLPKKVSEAVTSPDHIWAAEHLPLHDQEKDSFLHIHFLHK